jgi:hypothetical protein
MTLTLTPMEASGYGYDPVAVQPCWEELARQQLTHPEGWRDELETGDVVALLDRNCFTEVWQHRVFDLFDEDCIYLFDTDGQPIDVRRPWQCCPIRPPGAAW